MAEDVVYTNWGDVVWSSMFEGSSTSAFTTVKTAIFLKDSAYRPFILDDARRTLQICP